MKKRVRNFLKVFYIVKYKSFWIDPTHQNPNNLFFIKFWIRLIKVVTYFSSISFLPESNSNSIKLNLNFEFFFFFFFFLRNQTEPGNFARPRREQAIKASFLHAKSSVCGRDVGFVDAINLVKQVTSTFLIFQICCKLTFLSS